MIWRAVVVWLVIIVAEIAHGILRELTLVSWLGQRSAQQIGVATGSLLILIIAWCFSSWIAARRWRQQLLVGAIWVGLTLAFEVMFGRLVRGISWEQIAADYNLADGGFMGMGMLFLLLCPAIVARLRSRKTPA